MYKDALRAAWAEINITNLDFNIKQIKEKVGSGVKITGVVKADAYGHGSVRVATVLRANGIESFAVATLSEAVRLRKSGFVLEEIMVLSPVPEPYIGTIIEHRLAPVVCDYKNAEAISKAAAEAGILIKGYIAVDTGMGRIGYSDDTTSVEDVKMIAGLSNFKINGLFSHFATADEDDEPSEAYTREQFQVFWNVLDALAARGVDGDLDVPQLADGRVLQMQVQVPPQVGGPEAGAEAVLAPHAVLGERDPERGRRQRQRGEVRPDRSLPLLRGVRARVVGDRGGGTATLVDAHEHSGGD